MINEITPYIPSEESLRLSGLPDMAITMTQKSAALSGQLSDHTQSKIVAHMAVINSYYSNLIEGNKTRPFEIRQAQAGDFSSDTKKRDLQMESLAHIAVQQWIDKQSLDLNSLMTTDFIKAIHQEFYSKIPESLWTTHNKEGTHTEKVEPGQWRKHNVIVGHHVPPAPSELERMMQEFCDAFHPDRYSGDKKVIAIMAAHHRFAWVHPFTDGNGRVARLFTDAVLKAVGFTSCGVWCLSRGIARTADEYKSVLAAADHVRQGDLDGRGSLSEKALIQFCHYMLSVALDQIEYISLLLDLSSMHKRIERYVKARNDGFIKEYGSLHTNAAFVLYTAYQHGSLTRPLALSACGMPNRSARRLLAQLKIEGLLSETSHRSNIAWEIPEHAEPWYFPQLTP